MLPDLTENSETEASDHHEDKVLFHPLCLVSADLRCMVGLPLPVWRDFIFAEQWTLQFSPWSGYCTSLTLRNCLPRMYLQVLHRFGVGYALVCPRKQRALARAQTSGQMNCVVEGRTLPCVALCSACLCSAGTPWGTNCLALCGCTMHSDDPALG